MILRAQFSTTFNADGPWNQIFPRGTWHGANLAPVGGSIVIDDAFLAEIVANWKDAGSPPLPIRKTHQHLEDGINAVDRLELEKSYGFLTDMRVTAAGLEVKTAWNAAGEAEVKSGSFAFWSPEWQPKHRDRRTGDIKGWWLGGVALCNNPFFDSMPPVAAQTNLNEMPPVAASADDATTEPTPTKEQDMKPEFLKRMKAALKLAEETDDEALCAALEAKCQASLTASTEVITAAVKPVQEQVVSLTAQLAEEKSKGLARDVDALVATALRGDGKTGRSIPPALIAVAKDIASSKGLKASEDFLSALPLTVPTAVVGQAGTAEPVLTRESAQKKLDTRAAELRAAKVPDATFAAMKEMPDVALIASTPTPAQ